MSEIVFNAPASNDLNSQVESLQMTLASLNQQVIILQEAVQERDQEIVSLRSKLAEPNPVVVSSRDDTLTIVGALIKLYQFLIPPGKVS